MLYDRRSKLEFYGLGIVLYDKPLVTNDIIVTPMEELNLIDGDLRDWLVKYDITLPDINGEGKTSSIQMEAKLKCKWLPLSSDGNKQSAPDVVRNETVLILKFGDDDVYYWTTLFYEPHIRRYEHSVYRWGNKGTPLSDYDAKSSYWIEISTHKKHIWFRTNYDDGVPPSGDVCGNLVGDHGCDDCGGSEYPGTEKVIYEFKFDLIDGTFTLVDDKQNIIKLFSLIPKIEIKTKDVYIDGNVNISGALKVQKTIGTATGILSPSCCCTCSDPPSGFPVTADLIFK
jgi:hypothetical protein